MRKALVTRLLNWPFQFQNDLEQHLFTKLSGLTPMQAFNTIDNAVVEVGLQYFAAPSRRGLRRQPTLTSTTLTLVQQKKTACSRNGQADTVAIGSGGPAS